jgi:hypothetical protein
MNVAIRPTYEKAVNITKPLGGKQKIPMLRIIKLIRPIKFFFLISCLLFVVFMI